MESYLYNNCSYSYVNRKVVRQKNLVLNATRVTPRVVFIPEKEYLMIDGKSSPENAPTFYNLIIKRLYQFGKSGKTRLSVNFNFDYFNTSSAKCLYNLFKVLAHLKSRGMMILINWFYEDPDLLEAGKDFAEFFDLNFNLMPLEGSSSH